MKAVSSYKNDAKMNKLTDVELLLGLILMALFVVDPISNSLRSNTLWVLVDDNYSSLQPGMDYVEYKAVCLFIDHFNCTILWLCCKKNLNIKISE